MSETGTAQDDRWLIRDPDGRCWWREGRKGYGQIEDAGFYTKEEARRIERLGRGDKAYHVTSERVQVELQEMRNTIARFVERWKPDPPMLMSETGTAGCEDYEWAYKRVCAMAAEALIDASRLGPKLMKGFGYPNEIFSRAADYRALAIVIEKLPTPSRGEGSTP